MTTLHLPELHALGLTDLNTEVWLMRTPDDEIQPILVDQMEPRHQAAVLRWIRDNAAILERHQRRLIGHLRRTGAISPEEFTRRLNELDGDAAVWVENTALVRRLVQLVPRTVPPPRRRRLLPTRLLGGAR